MLAPVVSKRYAEALLDAAQASNAVADVEADLLLLAEVMSDPAASGFLLNPTIDPKEQRKRFLDPLAPKLKSKLVQNIIGLLIERRRAGVIPALPAAFRRLALESRGEAEGTVESSRAIGDAELRAIEGSVSGALGRKLKLTVVVKPELIGGLRVTVGSKRIDASVRSRLAALRERMLAAPLPQ
jgi:F-type H+-transporting ATPase subunit delta